MWGRDAIMKTSTKEQPTKPETTSMYSISYVLEGESRVMIVNLDGGKSYQSMRFPKGTKLQVLVSKLPTEEGTK